MPNDLLSTISLIINIQCARPSNPEFQFQLNRESEAKKFFVTNEYNKYLNKAIAAQFDSPLGYGSEFCPTNTLEVLSADKIRPYHVRQKDMKDTVGRYIVLIPEVEADSCPHDSE